jgi:hypothetical protein
MPKEKMIFHRAQGRMSRPDFGMAILVLSFSILAGCAQASTFTLIGTLPGADSLAGWTPAEKVQTYNRGTLFDYINGASEYFFTYTFEEVAVDRYIKSDGAELSAEVWQFAVPEDAFGLFSGRAGGTALSIGSANEAALETGSRLLFWQNRFYVTLTALTNVADEDLRRFAEFISKALPTGGDRPELISRLPPDGLNPESIFFFHQELAIQDRLWLGGENLLGLGRDTDAVFSRYRSDDAEWQLLLVQYPDSEKAEAGRQALEGGAAENLIAADINGALLGAVFGQGGEVSAEALLKKSLGK